MGQELETRNDASGKDGAAQALNPDQCLRCDVVVCDSVYASSFWSSSFLEQQIQLMPAHFGAATLLIRLVRITEGLHWRRPVALEFNSSTQLPVTCQCTLNAHDSLTCDMPQWHAVLRSA